MKKTLVALAALSAMSAFAQSSVTIYGAVDAGYWNATQDAGTSTTQRSAVGGGSAYTSRIGFTGVEDLGAGQKSGFTYEVALSSLGGDTANNAAFSNSNASGLRTGQVFISDAKLGTVTAGYGMTARHVQAATLDMTGGFNAAGNLMTAVGIGGNGTTAGTTGGAYTNMDYSLRANAVSWTSPTVNGWTGVYGHIFGDNTATTDLTDAKTSNTNARADLLAFNYANGPLTLMGSTTRTTTDATVAVSGTLSCLASGGNTITAMTATDTKCTNTTDTIVGGKAYAPANATVRTNNIIGGIYDLGYAKVSLGFYQDKLQNINWLTSKNDASDVLNRGYQIGIRGPIPGTKAEYVAQLAQGDYTKGGDNGEQHAQTGRTFGAIYNFSKRTSAYALYGVQTRDQAAAGTAFDTLRDTVYAVGLRHNF
jgi:predicted porin